LLHQQRLGLAGQAVQGCLDGCQVGYRFGERTGVLLQLRVAVELERIELHLPAFAMLVLEAGDDLGLGLYFQHAQLATQARHGLVEFDQVVPAGGDLLFQAGAMYRHLARPIDQVVEQPGAHTDLFLRRRGVLLLLGQQFGQLPLEPYGGGRLHQFRRGHLGRTRVRTRVRTGVRLRVRVHFR